MPPTRPRPNLYPITTRGGVRGRAHGGVVDGLGGGVHGGLLGRVHGRVDGEIHDKIHGGGYKWNGHTHTWGDINTEITSEGA